MTAPANATPLERLADAVAQHLTTVTLALEMAHEKDPLATVSGSAERLHDALRQARADMARAFQGACR